MDDRACLSTLRADDWITNAYPVQVMVRIHDATMSLHCHDFFEFVFMARGTAKHIVNGRATVLVPGDLFLVAPGEAHAYVDPRDAFIYNCLFTGGAVPVDDCRTLPVIGPLLVGDASPTSMVKAHASPKRLQAVSYLLEMMYDESRGDSPWKSAALRSLLTLFLIEASHVFSEDPTRAEDRMSAYVNKMRPIADTLHERLRQKLRIPDLAGEIGLSSSQFCRVFKGVYGVTPQEYIARLRVDSAMTLIATTRSSMADIALQCGFQDQSYFSRVFGRLVGMAPSEYRRDVESRGQVHE